MDVATVAGSGSPAGAEIRALNLRLDQLGDALKIGLLQLEDGGILLKAEMNERFTRVEKGLEGLALDELRERVGVLSERLDHLAKGMLPRMDKLDTQLFALTGQVNGLSDDMRQRFRVVNELLGDIDRRLAA